MWNVPDRGQAHRFDLSERAATGTDQKDLNWTIHLALPHNLQRPKREAPWHPEQAKPALRGGLLIILISRLTGLDKGF